MGGNTCNAELGNTVDGASPTVAAAQPFAGSATFACSSGAWGPPTQANCDCDAECECLIGGGTWIDALPERARTCTGNSGCTNHSHSCTTPADPAGGYQSCTYKLALVTDAHVKMALHLKAAFGLRRPRAAAARWHGAG